MAESTASSVTKNRIKTNYHGALEGFASYYFDVFPTETGPTSPTGEDDIRLKLLTKSNAFQRYFEIVDKKIFVEHLADIDIDNNIVFKYILWKRTNHFWPQNMQGQAHFDQVRSGILLRVNEVSTGPTMYSPQAKTNFTNFFQGLTNELADKQDEEGWVDHATSPIPWTVYCAMAMVLMQTNVVYWLLFLLQWNLMSRSVDVSKINITSISFNGDMLTINYTHRKTERKKKNSKPKKVHIASNPQNPVVCCVLALAAHLINKNIDNLRLFEGRSVQAGYSKAIEKALNTNYLIAIRANSDGRYYP